MEIVPRMSENARLILYLGYLRLIIIFDFLYVLLKIVN
jgi:hypothetical protein